MPPAFPRGSPVAGGGVGGLLAQLQGVGVEGEQAGLLAGGAGAQADADLHPAGGRWGGTSTR